MNTLDIHFAMHPTFFFVMAFILGACLASFFNVVIFRSATIEAQEDARTVKDWLEAHGAIFPDSLKYLLGKMTLSQPPSHCYSCKNELEWWHNVPIFGHIILRGRCGHCGAKYSAQYPIVEFLGGLTLALSFVFLKDQGSLVFFLGGVVFMSLFLLFFLDLKTYTLIESVMVSIIWISILASTYGISIIQNITTKNLILGCVLGYIIMYAIAFCGKLWKGEDVMGGGDAILVAALGAVAGWQGALFIIGVAPFIGAGHYLLHKIKNKVHSTPDYIPNDEAIPYGPSLIIAFFTYLFFGETIIGFLFP